MVGCLSGFPSLQQKFLKSWLVAGAQKAVQASAHATRMALYALPDANVEETVMDGQVLLQHKLPTNYVYSQSTLLYVVMILFCNTFVM